MQITLPPDAKRVKPNLNTSKPHCIVVDGSGVRYMRESGAPTDICRKMLERNRQVPAVPSFMIVDSQYINPYMLAGSMAGPKKPQAWFDSKNGRASWRERECQDGWVWWVDVTLKKKK